MHLPVVVVDALHQDAKTGSAQTGDKMDPARLAWPGLAIPQR
jgi:hypothetical protein